MSHGDKFQSREKWSGGRLNEGVIVVQARYRTKQGHDDSFPELELVFTE